MKDMRDSYRISKQSSKLLSTNWQGVPTRTQWQSLGLEQKGKDIKRWADLKKNLLIEVDNHLRKVAESTSSGKC